MVRTSRHIGADRNRRPFVANDEVRLPARGNHGWRWISSPATMLRRITSYATVFDTLRLSTASAEDSGATARPPYGELRVTVQLLDSAAAGWTCSGVFTLQRRGTPGESPASGRSSFVPGPAAEAATADRAGEAFIPGSARQMSMR